MDRSKRAAVAARTALLAGAAAVWALGAAARAAAAEAEASSGGAALAEVVVTAEKRETNLQQTPIAISVLGKDDLVARHVQSLADLSDGAIPSLRVAPFFARNSALTLGMRGVGAMVDANQPARDQAVGVYVDGVYLGRAQGLGAALYDVERIEVLKGPQGTLFGRNTEGGAISIVTRRPSGAFHSETVADYGNYGAYKFVEHLDLPAFHDVSLKFDGLISKRDGTLRNPTSSGQLDFNAFDKKGFHAEALWRPRDDFSADYAYDVAYDASTPYYVQLETKGSLPLAPAMHLQVGRAEQANVGVPLQWSIGDTAGHRLTLDWKLSNSLEAKTIASYRTLDESQYDNGEEMLGVYAPNGAFSRYSLAHTYQKQYSGEFQLLGSFPTVHFVAGAFYFHEAVRDNAQTPNTLQWNAIGTAASFLSVNLDTVPYDRASQVVSKSAGVFGQAVWTPELTGGIAHLTVGGRFTNDKKEGSLDVVNGALPSYVDASGTRVVGVIPLDKSWTRFDPLVDLAVDATQDVHLYGRWSTGYRAGGANSRSLIYRAFDPETVSMFELGAKTEFWDHRGRFNLAAFTGTLKDAQVDFNAVIPGNNRGTLETTNAADMDTKGVEFDLAVSPVDGLTFSAAYAYTKVDPSKAFNPFSGTVSTVYPLYTPKQAGSLAVDYARPFAGATLQAHADANFSGPQYTSTSDPTLSDRSTLVNARIGLGDIRLSDSAATLEVALWSRNLLDEEHAFLRNFSAALGTYAIYNEPRTFGVEASLKY
jgi:iron complex outermembrane receptor protein